jgi:hypothetical protein
MTGALVEVMSPMQVSSRMTVASPAPMAHLPAAWAPAPACTISPMVDGIPG